jgi:tripartite-type tricarboxylate transporter receptor subunit TctC
MPARLSPAWWLAVCLLCCLVWPQGARAAFQAVFPYPYEDSVILQPYDAEDGSAALLEALRPRFREATQRDFSVWNKPGRAGATAWTELGMQATDGYTLALTELTSLVLLSMQTHPPFRLDDFSQVCLLASAPLVLWAPASSPLSDLYDLLDQARAAPERVSIAGTGSGAATQLTSLRLNRQAGVKTAYRPYTGEHSAWRGAEGGAAQAFWGYPSLALLARGCRPLAVTSEKRHPLLPQAPTFLELGYDILEISYFGLAMSSQVSSTTARSAAGIYFDLARNPKFQAAITALGFEPAALDSGNLAVYLQQLAAYYRPLKEDYALP